MPVCFSGTLCFHCSYTGSGTAGESPVGDSNRERLFHRSGRHVVFGGAGYGCRVRSGASSLTPAGTDDLSLIDPRLRGGSLCM
ncbi:hypothetical protein NDU88_003560 [Pleurodeles waltl]|uniref:Secreted protein n=1 Tax=Pleurodeles waltl TaxID=8319 RepID=A0AAV7WRQ4_PLEWA|nr:hypothetical protein NDU88_003560 [Pleurodeles waltl]